MLTRIPLSMQSMHTTARSAQSQPARVPIGKCAPQPQTPARCNAKTFTALDIGLPVEPIYARYGLEGLRIRRMNALARRSRRALAACYVASGCALNGMVAFRPEASWMSRSTLGHLDRRAGGLARRPCESTEVCAGCHSVSHSVLEIRGARLGPSGARTEDLRITRVIWASGPASSGSLGGRGQASDSGVSMCAASSTLIATSAGLSR